MDGGDHLSVWLTPDLLVLLLLHNLKQSHRKRALRSNAKQQQQPINHTPDAQQITRSPFSYLIFARTALAHASDE